MHFDGHMGQPGDADQPSLVVVGRLGVVEMTETMSPAWPEPEPEIEIRNPVAVDLDPLADGCGRGLARHHVRSVAPAVRISPQDHRTITSTIGVATFVRRNRHQSRATGTRPESRLCCVFPKSEEASWS